MNEKSIVPRYLIIDHMQKNGLLPSAIKITNKLKRSVKTARQRYELNREQHKKSAKQHEHRQQLTILKSEIKVIMEKKQLLLEAFKHLDQEFVNTIKS